MDPQWDFLLNDYFGAHYDHDVDFLLDEKNKAAVKAKYYDSHIARVKKLVSDDKLLIYDIKHGWEPLCAFLDVPLPQNREVPRVNGKETVDMAFAVVERMVMQRVMKIVIVSATLVYAAVSVTRNIRKS